MDELEIFLRVSFMGIAVLLFCLSLYSYSKVRGTKLLLACGAFGVLALEGVLMVAGVISGEIEDHLTVSGIAGLNLVALLLFYLSFLKR